MNKKGLSMTLEKVGILILSVAVLMLVINIMSDYFISVKQKAELQTCKNSVIAHASLKFDDFDASNNIDCPIIDVEVKAKTKDAVMYNMAERMAQCWDIYGEGKLQLFEMEPDKETNYCAVCHYMTFDDDVEIEMKDFLQYLETKKYKDKTYMEYLAPYSTKTDLNELEYVPIIDTSNDYGIFMVYTKDEYDSPYSVAKIGGVIGGAVTTVLAIVGSTALAIIPEPTITKVGAAALAGVAIGGVSGYMSGDDEKNWKAYVTIQPYNNQFIGNLSCDQLPVRGGKGK